MTSQVHTDVVPAGEQAVAAGVGVADFALLFELDNLAVPGRKASFDLLKSMLGEQSITFTQALFSRYCLCLSPRTCVPALIQALEAKRVSADKLTEDLESGLAMFFASKDATLDKGLDRILAVAQENGIPVGALSGLSEETAAALMEKLGLAARGVQLFTFPENHDVFPRADTWMKVAKSMTKDSRRCVVLVSSAASSKAALSAGMSCVAVPDMFTMFQDFAGAQMVLDSLKDVDPTEFILSLFPVLK